MEVISQYFARGEKEEIASGTVCLQSRCDSEGARDDNGGFFDMLQEIARAVTVSSRACKFVQINHMWTFIRISGTFRMKNGLKRK